MKQHKIAQDLSESVPPALRFGPPCLALQAQLASVPHTNRQRPVWRKVRMKSRRFSLVKLYIDSKKKSNALKYSRIGPACMQILLVNFSHNPPKKLYFYKIGWVNIMNLKFLHDSSQFSHLLFRFLLMAQQAAIRVAHCLHKICSQMLVKNWWQKSRNKPLDVPPSGLVRYVWSLPPNLIWSMQSGDFKKIMFFCQSNNLLFYFV